MLPSATENPALTARDVKLAVLVAAFDRHFGPPSIIEDCIAALEAITPVRATGPGPISLAEIRARTLFAEVRADFVRIKPLVELLGEAVSRPEERSSDAPGVLAVKQTENPKACLRDTWAFLTIETRKRSAGNPAAMWVVARCVACGICGVGK